jgi:hypothetical protein
MIAHPYLLMLQVAQHHDDLIAEATRHKLLNMARESRRAARNRNVGRHTAQAERAEMSLVAGNLATCDPHVVGSAR